MEDQRILSADETAAELEEHVALIAHEFRDFEDVAERTAFLVDQSGTVRDAWRYETAEVPDFDELLSAARAL